ncbi:MAG: YggS family pyridoxal phosphate-dependent enzyme [Verrucomicrobia bacterium]|nr:YggS family pyridoxal phosphate-dependent enzyme [Verrucomicrobiota bacterium]
MTDQESASMEERIGRIRERMAAAALRAGRSPDEVELIAVSKNHGPDRIREAARCGLRIFGENRVQEARAKMPECPGTLSWHLIGHLQRNKAAQAVALFDRIHSVDSVKLLEALNQACDQAGKSMDIFLEVNVSGEGTKFGFSPEAVPDVLRHGGDWPRLVMVGLMTIPPFTQDPEGARPHFRQLRAYQEQWQQETGIPLESLSMGMSHDFEVAIEEGSHWVRIGTAIFGERSKAGMQ